MTFEHPLRIYADFAIWPDGVIGPPDASYEAVQDGEVSAAGAVHAAECVYAAHPGDPASESCEVIEGATCKHWAIFDSDTRGEEIERIDMCGVFSVDEEAIAAAVAFYDQHAKKREPR